MVNVTINVDMKLKKSLARHPEINWSEVARQAWQQKIQNLDLLDELTSKSKASDDDVEDLARKLKKGIAERHGRKPI